MPLEYRLKVPRRTMARSRIVAITSAKEMFSYVSLIIATGKPGMKRKEYPEEDLHTMPAIQLYPAVKVRFRVSAIPLEKWRLK